MELTHELRENAGLQWVLERLSPLSPFGKQAARTPRWYGPGEEAALEEAADQMIVDELKAEQAVQVPTEAPAGDAGTTQAPGFETPRYDAPDYDASAEDGKQS